MKPLFDGKNHAKMQGSNYQMITMGKMRGENLGENHNVFFFELFFVSSCFCFCVCFRSSLLLMMMMIKKKDKQEENDDDDDDDEDDDHKS